MKRKIERGGIVIWALISLAIVIPSMGYCGGAEPCIGTTYVLPAYFGTLTAEWVSECATSTDGCVLVYGNLRSGETGYRDIIIKKTDAAIIAGTSTAPIFQVDFLALDSSQLKGNYSFDLPDGCYQFASVNDLTYKSETSFTANVVVMKVQ